MTKKLLAAALACLALVAAQAQKSTATLTVSGLPDGVRVVVAETEAGRLVPTDTLAPDKKGRLHIERYSHQPQFLVLTLTREKSPVVHLLMLPSEKISLALAYLPDLNLLDITSAQGSDNMALYQAFTRLAVSASRQRRPQLVDDSLAVLLDARPGLLMSALLATYYEQRFEQYAPLYKKIRDANTPAYADHEFVQHLDSRLRSALLPGSEAPDIVMAGPDGTDRRLSDLRGKVVLVDFWASWCRPCRMENPNVVRLYNRFHDRGFEVFSVSLDQNRDAWLKAIQDDGLAWPNHVSDLRGWQSAAGRLYGISSIPATVLVDRQGNIVARNLRGQDLENKLNEIFAQ